MKRDPFREGTESHYRDAVYYDHAYRRRKVDVAYYARMADELGSPVLELGVGTGRVAEAIARRGHTLVGVDLMAPMLERAGERLARASSKLAARVTLHRADLREVRLRRRFPLVIAPFNVFMHLYTREDFERALGTVRAHLAEGGRFVFDVLMPDAEALARDPARLYRCGSVKPAGRPRARYSESFDFDPVSQVMTITMVFEPEEPSAPATVHRLAHRQFFPRELEALLHYNGFAVERAYGGFDGEPYDLYAESQVIVARLR